MLEIQLFSVELSGIMPDGRRAGRAALAVLLLVWLSVAGAATATAQGNPYAMIGPVPRVEYAMPFERMPRLVNADTASDTAAMLIDGYGGKIYFVDASDSILGTAELPEDAVLMWLSVDPMADKYPGISPYAYCNWNPVRYVDPDGMKWDPSSLEILDQYKKAVEDALMGARTKQQREEIQGALSELDALSKSNQMYHIEYGTPDGHNTKGGTSYDIENDWVSVVVSWDANTGDMAHELKHAYQFEVGELSFDSRSGSGAESHLYDITDEQAAYRRGNAFGNQIPKNLEWHEKFKRSNGGYYYPFLDPTYVKSPDRAEGRKASRYSSLIHNAKTPLKSPLNIIYRYEGKTYRK